MNRTYTDSLYYHLKLTARYLEVAAKQLFKTINLDELITLDLIKKNEGLCQRDLAKILLKDRANTGRIISSLEKSNLVEIKLGKKNNRIIKSLTITQNGINLLKESKDKFEAIFDKEIRNFFKNEEEDNIIKLLKDFRDKLNTIANIDI